jgi:sortase A
VARTLNFIGKLLISVGFGFLLYVAWILKGTDLITERRQDELARRLNEIPPVEAQVETSPSGIVYRGPGKGFKPGPGDPVFRLQIPDIRESYVVVEGVGEEELKAGPGHYPSCRKGFSRPLCTIPDEVWPGERGRAIVSGHRTTYGAPFWDLDKLRRGDEIIIVTKWGDFLYEVSGKQVVPANALDIANPTASESAEIVLTTCNPKFSAAQRLVVFATMVA